MSHQRLSAKLKIHGITGQNLHWIQSWLNGRKQCVVLNGSQSDWTSVPSGVPHGSSLVSPLFIIFINDIDNAVDVKSCCLLNFADVTKGLHEVNTPNNALKLENLYL